jgi:hypothetical protein
MGDVRDSIKIFPLTADLLRWQSHSTSRVRR